MRCPINMRVNESSVKRLEWDFIRNGKSERDSLLVFEVALEEGQCNRGFPVH